MWADKNKVFRLQGKVQHYDWGGDSFLPNLLGIMNPDNKPFAEYWMGAHEQASSGVIIGDQTIVPLNHYIRDFPEHTIGKRIAGLFGQLPYLLKVLDVKNMLSIQVHPSKENALKSFDHENKLGIDRRDARRNYKDDNHKPELMLALSKFWLLHGFKPEARLDSILKDVPELNFLSEIFRSVHYRELYQTVMELPQSKVDDILAPLIARIVPEYKLRLLSKKDEHFWAARAALTFNQGTQIDRGIFSIYFFNLLNLQPGEAIFQDAGLPHAYLEGQNIEIMANSDNVLRGGLTTKHIDVKELLKHVKFEATEPKIIHGKKISEEELVFSTPAPDFELRLVILEPGETYFSNARGLETFLVIEGEAEVWEQGHDRFIRNRGEAFVSFDGAKLNVEAIVKTVICKASVPDRKI